MRSSEITATVEKNKNLKTMCSLQRLVHQVVLLVLLILCQTIEGDAAKGKASSSKQLLLVSFDGFRWDYLSKFGLNLPNFDRLKKAGVSIKDGGNIPPFFTYTFPSHYTAVTGLYEESHGIVGNSFWDPVFKEKFSMYNSATNMDPKWWNGGEPIWVTTRLRGLTSATFFWPGSEAEIRGMRPNHWKKYNGSISFEERVEQGLNWLQQGINFVCVYFNEPDHAGHGYGPNSQEVSEQVVRMDRVLGLFLDGLHARQLDSKVNFLLTSDHGMTNIWPNQSISLADYIDMKTIHLTTWGPAAFIHPKDPNQTFEIYKLLEHAHPHMKVFLKNDIPERWNYKNNRRISPIYAVADESWIINGTKGFYIDKQTNQPLAGMHGYDNILPSMQPIFLAQGPDIAVNKRISPFETVNYYRLMCDLLDIEPAPNNGTTAAFRDVLASGSSSVKQQKSFLLCVYLFVVAFRVL